MLGLALSTAIALLIDILNTTPHHSLRQKQANTGEVRAGGDSELPQDRPHPYFVSDEL